MDLRIVVLQRRWHLVGVYTREGLYARLSHCSVIRRWGTTDGLGELAEKGPLASTELDAVPRGVEYFEPTAVFTLHCNVEAWAEYLESAP